MWILVGLALILLGLTAYSDIKNQTIEPITLMVFSVLGILYRGYIGTFYYGFWELFLRLVPGILFLLLALLKKEWIGLGDGLLLLVTGYLLGAILQLILLAVSFGISGIYGIIVLILKKKGPKERIPFAPFLFAAMVFIMIGMILLKGDLEIA